jgi:hypothetical protein
MKSFHAHLQSLDGDRPSFGLSKFFLHAPRVRAFDADA